MIKVYYLHQYSSLALATLPFILLQFWQLASVLKDMRIDLGSYGYAGQMMQKPAPDEGGIFKKNWFKIITWDQFIEDTKGKKVVWNFKIDGAFTEDKSNDPTGIYCSVFVNNNIYIRSFEEVWKEFPSLLRHLAEIFPKHGLTPRSKVHVEPKANGLSIIQSLRDQTTYSVMPYRFPKTSKISLNDSKETRATAITLQVESGRVILLDGSWNKHFTDQCGAFPKATHDEGVDCLVMDVAENFFNVKPKGVRRR